MRSGGDETANARYGRWDWRGRGRKEGGNGKEMAVLEKRGHATHVSLFHKTCLFLPMFSNLGDGSGTVQMHVGVYGYVYTSLSQCQI